METNLLTAKQLAEKFPAFSEAAIRAHIFYAKARRSTVGVIPGNGLDQAIVRLGRRVLIDEQKFIEWVDLHRSKTEKR